jgi:citryl-CoA synthetase large subunit
MNLYEWEGKQLFSKHGIATLRSVLVRRGEDVASAYASLGAIDVVVKAQVLSGKRGKNNGMRFCSTAEDVVSAATDLFSLQIRDQHVAAVLIEEKLDIAQEHYLSITYDTRTKQPLLVYSKKGGMDIEDVSDADIEKVHMNVLHPALPEHVPYAQELWHCFVAEDCRVVEINPLAKTTDGHFVAVDAKVALDDDAFYRHPEWTQLEPRTMMGRSPTEREIAVKKIDEGEGYYRGTAGKYVEMSGDIAILFSGGGASIANMDALIAEGLAPANYTEYSGNPPREKVYQLAKIVLSKPGLRGLWICGGVANFTNIEETFHGIVDALDEMKPRYPIVVRRAGPNEDTGMKLMRECAERNGLTMKLFGKEVSMGETARVLSQMVIV